MAKTLRIAGLALALGLGVTTSQAQPSPSMSTQDFVQAAQASDAYEIEAGQVAVIQSRDPRVLSFARQMMRDHARTSQALRQAVAASGMTPPPMALGDDQAKFLGQLQSLSGAEFDKAYVRQQLLAHQAALVVEQGYAATGADPNVRRAAQAAVPVIRQHLAMARQLQP